MHGQNIDSLREIVLSNELGSHRSVSFGEMICSYVDFSPKEDMVKLLEFLKQHMDGE